jgi:hypothetical protein
MRTKFTRASRKDKTLVTVSLAQFDEEDVLDRSRMSMGDYITLYVDGEPVTFAVNRVRDGKATTAVSHCFPRFLRLPRIGRPIYAQVTELN